MWGKPSNLSFLGKGETSGENLRVRMPRILRSVKFLDLPDLQIAVFLFRHVSEQKFVDRVEAMRSLPNTTIQRSATITSSALVDFASPPRPCRRVGH